MSNDGVHETHCCASIHGCKYMDNDCPVENKRILPKYKCQDCEETKQHYQLFPMFMPAQVPLELDIAKILHDNLWNLYVENY